jgi:exopolysaccharide biosynthesis protein
MEWQSMESVNLGLSTGVRVYAGINPDLPLRAWYVRVDRRDPRIATHVVLSTDDDLKETVASFAERLGAPVTVNGGYFLMQRETARHVGLLHMSGMTIESATTSVRRDTLSYPVARAALGFLPDGSPDVAWVTSRGDSLFEWTEPFPNREGTPASRSEQIGEIHWPALDAVAAGPVLIENGEVRIPVQEEVFFGSSIPEIHPRTAVGYTAEGDLILLVVDGRQAVSRGVDLSELAIMMHDLGCIEAMNMDGGGSSTLVVNGVLLNRPAGGTFQREVMSAIAVLYR